MSVLNSLPAATPPSELPVKSTQSEDAATAAKRLALGVFVGERQNWTFFRELFEDLDAHYDVSVFRPRTYRTPLLYGRLNRWAYRHRVRSILKRSDAAFFEWASEILEVASHMPKLCPVVVRLHSFELHAWAPRIDWTKVDRIILVSEAMRQNFCSIYPQHAHKTTVVYNGVSLDRFSPAARGADLNIGMLGTIIPRKRVYETILAFAKLKRQGVQATLHLGGGPVHGPGQDEYYVVCHRLVQTLGLERSVVFYDHVYAPEDWLKRIDVLISNSYWEGQQVALLEAMASGCYCLSHKWMGAEEILPPDLLYVTEDELVDKLNVYTKLNEITKRERHFEMRRIAVDTFDLKRQKLRIREVIESAFDAPS